ncbi:MAG: ferritin family protein [Candidatus Cloacimonetes bacterium]|nr:ferritin family protein [Candidatus Cloacimonadota bacterium]
MVDKKELLVQIKKGLKAEMDSVTMYESAASGTDDAEVKNFFLSRAEEEKNHYNSLLDYYKGITEDNDTSGILAQLKSIPQNAPSIFSEDFKKRIAENQALFSAISVAILLEKNAIDFYRNAAEKFDDSEMKEFFQMMTLWEEYHYTEVNNIMKEVEEYYWQINHFAPF